MKPGSWWSLLKTLWTEDAPIPLGPPKAPPPVDEERPAATEPKTPREWLDEGQRCKNQSDPEGAVTAFRTAALLFWDEKKAPQARASLKLAIELSPKDEYLRASLRNFQSTDPLHDGPTRKLTLAEAQALSAESMTRDEQDAELPDFARPTVVDLQLLGLRGTGR